MTQSSVMILFLFALFLAVSFAIVVYITLFRAKKCYNDISLEQVMSTPTKSHTLHDISIALLRLLGRYDEKSANLCKQRLDACCSRQSQSR